MNGHEVERIVLSAPLDSVLGDQGGQYWESRALTPEEERRLSNYPSLPRQLRKIPSVIDQGKDQNIFFRQLETPSISPEDANIIPFKHRAA